MLQDSLNLSTKFIKNDLGDPINYKTYLHNVDKSDNIPEIPTRYQNKERILKDRDSINSFRIYDTNLKKRTNPSDVYKQEIEKRNNEEKQRKIKLSQPLIQPSWIISDPHKSQKENLLNALESQVNLLKEETENNLRLNNSHISNGAKHNSETNNFSLIEPHVDTHFFNNENGVVQVFKHVKTMTKPEYMNLETLAKLRENNSKKLIELEKEYKIAKDREKLEKFKEEQSKLNKKYNYKPEVLEELKEILKKENELFHFEKKNKKRPLSSKNKISIENIENPIVEKSINKSQEKFVRKFAKYKIEKKMNNLEEEKEKMKNKPWNYTKIESKNIHGTVDRNDNLPGYFGKVDLSLYYYDIQDNKKEIPDRLKAPHWNTITRTDLKKHYDPILSKQKENLNKEKESKNNGQKNNKCENKEIIDPLKEEEIMKETAENLTKDIFDYFNQEFIFGLVTKSQIATEFNFEPDELIKLKFKSKKEFIDILNEFKTDLYSRMNYEELKKCLLSKLTENGRTENLKISDNKMIDKKEQINSIENPLSENDTTKLNTKKIDDKENEQFDIIRNQDNNKMEIINNNNNGDEYKEENTSDKEEDIEILDDEDDNSDYLPVYNTKNIVIKYDSTEKRLEETNKLLYKLKVPPSTTDDIEEDSLEIKIDLNLDKENPKEVTYFDFKKVINKYSDKNNIDFTIPQPFDFQKDSKSKINGANRLKKFLISRKEAEDKIMNNQFRANDLKTEIFIGNINNLMEADKNAKKKRVEKGMKKLQEQMCPFSFVEEDEKKQKIKLEKQKKYESTKEKFKQFKAKPIKHTSRGGLNAEEIAKKENEERAKRIQENAKRIYIESKMPPGMELHEKNQKLKRNKLMAEEKKRKRKEDKERKEKKNLDPPKWDKVHKLEEKKLKEKKKKNDRIKEEKATKIKEFNLHEGHKKENLYQIYMENGGQIYKEPSIKKNIMKFDDEYEKKQNE